MNAAGFDGLSEESEADQSWRPPSPTARVARAGHAVQSAEEDRQEEEEDDDEPVFLAVKSEQDRTELGARPTSASDAGRPPPAPVATGDFGPVLKSMRTAPHVRGARSALLSRRRSAQPSATVGCGYVCIDAGGQLGHRRRRPRNDPPRTRSAQRTRSRTPTPTTAHHPSLGPVGSTAYTPQGTEHDWLYTSLEDAGRDGRTCEMDVGGRLCGSER